jgi:hypothetical protein
MPGGLTAQGMVGPPSGRIASLCSGGGLTAWASGPIARLCSKDGLITSLWVGGLTDSYGPWREPRGTRGAGSDASMGAEPGESSF